MTSGVACPGDRCHDGSVRTVLNKELNFETGEKILYDTGVSHLLSAVLAEVTGMRIKTDVMPHIHVDRGHSRWSGRRGRNQRGPK
ncbi:MAG: hypothetical protein ACI9EW_002184, partial [Cellvibrionaceae bacterium]